NMKLPLERQLFKLQNGMKQNSVELTRARRLALARMQKQQRELWRRSTLAHKNQPAKLHDSLSNDNIIFPLIIIFSSQNAIKRIVIFLNHS
ncbi:hypothetical protein L9F63_008475, partial [Diploptera punctata]